MIPSITKWVKKKYWEVYGHEKVKKNNLFQNYRRYDEIRRVFSCPHGSDETIFERFLAVRMDLAKIFLKGFYHFSFARGCSLCPPACFQLLKSGDLSRDTFNNKMGQKKVLGSIWP